MNYKGSLPLLILHVLSREPNHGYQIAKLIKEQSNDVLDFKEGTLYPTLHALEKQHLIESSTAKINGRKRRYYRITEKGRKSLDDEHVQWARFANAVNLVLGANET